MAEKVYTCFRLRAGVLVIEYRYWMPRRLQRDSQQTRKIKNDVRDKVKRCAINRPLLNRLEAGLGFLGYDAWESVLTFADEPKNYAEVQKKVWSFLRKLKRWKGRKFDWIYVIECKHGEGRFHVHFCYRYRDFSPEEIRHLWKFGSDEFDEPVVINDEWFYRLAKYLTKESADGIKRPVGSHVVSFSKSVQDVLKKKEQWTECSSQIDVPKGSLLVRRPDQMDCGFAGEFYYKAYVVLDKTFDCQRACARARVHNT